MSSGLHCDSNNKQKHFPYWPTRVGSLHSGHASYMLNSGVPSGAVTANRDSTDMRNHNKQTLYSVNIFV
jgi:hypothetical protein